MAQPLEVTARTFEDEVLNSEVPVLVDFWAPWCGPCRVLGPILERLAREMQGAFVLAKVNVDQNPGLSRRFGVQGIPMVTAFRDGQVADTFTGALPESQVRAWLRKLIPSGADRLAAEAAQLAESDPQAAAARYRAALEQDPAHQPSLLGLGRILLVQSDPEAVDVLKRIPAGSRVHAEAQALLGLSDFLATPPAGEQGSDGNAPAGNSETGARYAAAAAFARAGKWEQALEELLAIVQRDRAYAGDGARRTMLAIFALLGEADPLVARYRRLLANALF